MGRIICRHVKSVIDAISCRIVQMLSTWRYHQGISVVPWLAMVWVYKTGVLASRSHRSREIKSIPFCFSLERKGIRSLHLFFSFHFFTLRSRIACVLFSFGLRPSVLYAVHGQWVHRLAGLRRCVSLLRIPLWYRALRWSRVRVGSRRCVIPSCFAEVVGGARGR